MTTEHKLLWLWRLLVVAFLAGILAVAVEQLDQLDSIRFLLIEISISLDN